MAWVTRQCLVFRSTHFPVQIYRFHIGAYIAFIYVIYHYFSLSLAAFSFFFVSFCFCSCCSFFSFCSLFLSVFSCFSSSISRSGCNNASIFSLRFSYLSFIFLTCFLYFFISFFVFTIAFSFFFFSFSVFSCFSSSISRSGCNNASSFSSRFSYLSFSSLT